MTMSNGCFGGPCMTRSGKCDAGLQHDASQCPHAYLSHTIAENIGTLLMFVVRNIFSQPGRLTAKMQELAAAGLVPQWLADTDSPLGFLLHESGARSVTDAAYRFVRHEPGVHVVLFGTSTPEHLRANIDSLLQPPLPEADRQQLATLFGHLLGVGLELPDYTTT